MNLAKYLTDRSQEICRDNNCRPEADEHSCGSFAYITHDMRLIDVCLPDYFAGYGGHYAAIPLPWRGTQQELQKEVQEQIGSYDQVEHRDGRDES
ncbi:MAG: hypothetical protein HY548_09345 [Elusimicrobia bacterium]|nr:hypothetical protein [Elusimicrobiota bacterium]